MNTVNAVDPPDLLESFTDEIVTHAHVRDVELPDDGGTLALVTLDNGLDHTRPTTLGPRGLTEFGEALDGLAERARAGEIVGVGVTGKPFLFAAGADLAGVAKIAGREHAEAIGRLGHDVFGRLATLGVPSFAFVNGVALGGGLELALHCTYRTISSAVPAVGLPECFLGLVPGWGGCWLVPNLVGIEAARTVVIDNPLNQNRTLSGPRAQALGLFDVLLEPADFLVQSIRWAAGVLGGELTVERPGIDRDERTWEGVVSAAREAVLATTGGAAPAPLRALDLLSAARTIPREEGFAAEDAALADLLMGPELRAGLYAFDLVQKRAKRPAGAPDPAAARRVTKVGVVGAGLMAGQLAHLFVRRLEVPVVLTDLDEDRVRRGVEHVHAEIDKLLAKGRLSQDAANRQKALVAGSTDKAGFADADVVVEAVFERMSVKRQVFAEVEAVVRPECVLATNTSSLSITAMAAELAHPERVVGLHFFNPVAVMPLVEIVQGRATDEATLATAFATARTLKKTAILVQDSPSFIVNRLLGRFMSDVGRIADEGTPLDTIEGAFSGVAPMPPFLLMELVGPAIALHNNETLAAAFPERFSVSPQLRDLVASKRSALYRHDEGGSRLDPEVLELWAKAKRAPGGALSGEQVRRRVLEGLAQEARLMLEEGVVAAPMDLDLAMITGAGFPFWNGGLTPLLDRTGIAESAGGGRFLPRGTADVPA